MRGNVHNTRWWQFLFVILKRYQKAQECEYRNCYGKAAFYGISLANIATYKENTRTLLIKGANGTGKEVEVKNKKKKTLDG